jgi:hypothetical protein
MHMLFIVLPLFAILRDSHERFTADDCSSCRVYRAFSVSTPLQPWLYTNILYLISLISHYTRVLKMKEISSLRVGLYAQRLASLI